MKRIAQHAAGEFIAAGIPFHASAMRGTTSAPLGTGEMPEPFASDYYAAGVTGSLAYVVMSYETPIAWQLTSGEWVAPNVRYGMTTTTHQTAVRCAVESLTEYPAQRIDAPSYEWRKPYRRPRVAPGWVA